MIGAVVDAALDAIAVFFMSREQERRWVNSDRGDRRPTYAPPITRHHQAWPHEQWPGGEPAHQPWPHQEWPGGGGGVR
jgi:hypothetical protein